MVTEIESGTVSFAGKSGKISGFLCKPALSGTKNAIIIVHEWWGLTDFVKNVAKSFARQGYVSLAVDLYDGKTTMDASQASELMNSLDQEKSIGYLSAALGYLKKLGVKKIGVMGFSMGGKLSMIFASTEKLDAAVDFYGVHIPAQVPFVKNLSCPVLCIFGGKDKSATNDDINVLRRELVKNSKKNVIEIYPNAGHAFIDNTQPQNYNKDASIDAWQKVFDFLNDNLK